MNKEYSSRTIASIEIIDEKKEEDLKSTHIRSILDPKTSGKLN